MVEELKKLNWCYAKDTTITNQEKEQIRNVDPNSDGILTGQEIELTFNQLEKKWNRQFRIDYPHYQALNTILLRFHDELPPIYFRILRCIHRPAKDPKEINLIKCTEGKKWRPVETKQLIHEPALAKRVSAAIKYIENNGYGKVDTYSSGKKCDTFHFHVILKCCDHIDEYMENLIEARKKAGSAASRYKRLLTFAIQLLKKSPQDIAILYHTDEYTTRFTVYSKNRNLADEGDGLIKHYEGPKGLCFAVGPQRFGNNLFPLNFAIVPEGHDLYEHGHTLSDGRRFIIWEDFDYYSTTKKSN